MKIESSKLQNFSQAFQTYKITMEDLGVTRVEMYNVPDKELAPEVWSWFNNRIKIRHDNFCWIMTTLRKVLDLSVRETIIACRMVKLIWDVDIVEAEVVLLPPFAYGKVARVNLGSPWYESNTYFDVPMDHWLIPWKVLAGMELIGGCLFISRGDKDG